MRYLKQMLDVHWHDAHYIPRRLREAKMILTKMTMKQKDVCGLLDNVISFVNSLHINIHYASFMG